LTPQCKMARFDRSLSFQTVLTQKNQAANPVAGKTLVP
jgi:hypothetical protein